MLRLAARRHPDDEDLVQAGEELSFALQELRELARGIHPAVLTERGLEPAVRAVADRAPVPVELSVALDERLPGPVEAAAYYVVAEALTNVAKYACATEVSASAWSARTGTRGSRCATTASAVPRPGAAPGCAGSRTASRRSAGGSPSTARSARARPCGRRSRLRPAELLRAVTAALTSPDEETAFARLPGTLKRSLNGHKKVTWDGSDAVDPGRGRRGAARAHARRPTTT